MCIFCILIILLTVVIFLTRHQKIPKLHGHYAQHCNDAWYYVKLFLVATILRIVKIYRRFYRRKHREEERKQHFLNYSLKNDEVNSLTFAANDRLGNVISVLLRRHPGLEAEVGLTVRLADGRTLSIPFQPGCTTVDETPSGDEADENYISAGGVRIFSLIPVKTYRILYSGLMRLQEPGEVETTPPKYIEVNIRLWFKTLSDPANFTIDYSSSNTARRIAVEEAPLSVLRQFLSSTKFHAEQSGEMRGFVEVNETKFEVTLNGLRDHFIVPFDESANSNGFFILQAHFENGLVFSLHVESQLDAITHSVSGFVTFQTGYVYPVTWTDLHLAHLPSQGKLPKNMNINLSAHGRIYELSVEVISTRCCQFASKTDSSSLVVYENTVKASLNGTQTGYGTIKFNNRGQRDGAKMLPLESKLLGLGPPFASQPPPLCVQLQDSACRLPQITGGKAAKLADILAVLSDIPETPVDFEVPDGFVATVAAYDSHVKEHPHLSSLIKRVLDFAYRLNQCSEEEQSSILTANLQDACESLTIAFVQSSLSETLEKELELNMKKAFGDQEWSSTFTAIRSSAVGEDGSEASGAGQMETFLGRRGLEKVVEAVKMCWASMFSFRAVQYRRQLCVKLEPSMAVLVQRLVKANVAGVLFTRNPDSGSTCHSIINASRGIGEGVVSGHLQPDTISIYRVDPYSEDIRIAYDVLGEKANVYRLDESKQVVEEVTRSRKSVEVERDETCCLSEAEIRRLWKVGCFVERIFRSARDIEFAVTKDSPTVFILQARQITTVDAEQEWELLHEFDSPLASHCELITTANFQEIVPGALAPLCARTAQYSIGAPFELFQSEVYVKPRRRFELCRSGSLQFQHLLVNWTIFGVGMKDDFNKQAAELALFGRRLEQTTSKHYEEQNDMYNSLWLHLLNLHMWKRPFIPRKGMAQYVKELESYQVPTTSDPPVLFKHIEEEVQPFVQKVWNEHIIVSFNASFLQTVMMTILDKDLNWGPQIYEDMATMLSTCGDVYSADVPILLQNIANSIKNDTEANDLFMKMGRSEASRWLLSAAAKEHGDLFRAFIAKHGHRCVRDADLREKSWNQEPEKLVDVLKEMISSNVAPIGHKTTITVEEALHSIKTPLNSLKRLILKKVLNKSRTLVAEREWTKSCSIKASSNHREAYYRLAKLMTEQGYLPDADLIFFLVPEEIEKILEKRSPKLVAKALRRRKLFTKFNNLRLPEITNGHPSPMAPKTTHEQGALAKIKGVAVGKGCARGVARVVSTLADANKIQKGEIIVVRCTDIGWTPYFPMISGLVTELGGLISHGAVVAREYGLPCLVGCKNATELVKTGDHIYIDGPRGEVSVIANENAE